MLLHANQKVRLISKPSLIIIVMIRINPFEPKVVIFRGVVLKPICILRHQAVLQNQVGGKTEQDICILQEMNKNKLFVLIARVFSLRSIEFQIFQAQNHRTLWCL